MMIGELEEKERILLERLSVSEKFRLKCQEEYEEAKKKYHSFYQASRGLDRTNSRGHSADVHYDEDERKADIFISWYSVFLWRWRHQFSESGWMIRQTFVGMVFLFEPSFSDVWDTDDTSWWAVTSHSQRNSVDAESFCFLETHPLFKIGIDIAVDKATAWASHGIGT